MYSIVMLTAMSAGADVTPSPVSPAPAVAMAPAVGCCGGGIVTGCSGCYGSCSGSCYGSCHGSCHGCCGGFLGLRSAGLFGWHSCHGCCGGSCHGSSCFGSCHGSCHGYSCSGYSCFGSCHGCYGSSWGPAVGMAPYTLHGYNLADPIAVYGGVTNPNQPPVMTVPPAPMTKPTASDGTPMGANLKFKVPAETKLYVDGTLAAGVGAERAFFTPPLARGKKFFYDVEAKLVVNGKEVVESKKVIVEAGASITEEFAKLTAAVAAPDAVAGK